MAPFESLGTVSYFLFVFRMAVAYLVSFWR